jgi:AraC-like DNA-binding protein
MVDIPRMSFRRQLHRTVTAKSGTTVSLDSALEPSGTTPNVTTLFPVRHARVTHLPNSWDNSMGRDSSLLLHEGRLNPGEEWEFPGSGWSFLWPVSGDGYLMGGTPCRSLSAGMVAVHGGTCSLRLRASQLGNLSFRWFRLDPTTLFGVFTLLERRRIDHPDQINPALPWVLDREDPATERFANTRLSNDTASLEQRARLLELVSKVLSPPAYKSSIPVGSPRNAGDRLEELLHQLTDAELMSLPVEELARRCHCETRRLLLIYRERFGSSLPGQQREWLKVKACAMLAQADSDIASVAKACGYEGVDAFRAWFRRQFGMAPTQWQQQRQQQVAEHSSLGSMTIK